MNPWFWFWPMSLQRRFHLGSDIQRAWVENCRDAIQQIAENRRKPIEITIDQVRRDPNAVPIYDAHGNLWAPPDPEALRLLMEQDMAEAWVKIIESDFAYRKQIAENDAPSI